ncbi:MAG TPA: hypothetical protein VEX62_03995 [Candidatus Limnocylindrales bacterium]|nr:hypothetical protein [Candidatus Limnocylindrales bacterium]
MNQMPGAFPPPPDTPQQPFGPGGPPAPGRPAYPLDFERILQLTFSLYRYAFVRFFAVGLALYLPLVVVTTALQLLMSADLIRAQQAQLDYFDGRVVPLTELLPVTWMALGFFSLIIIGAGVYVAQGGLVHLTARTYTGERPSAPASIRAAVSRLLTLVGAGLLAILLTIGILLMGAAIGTLLILGNVVNGALQPGLLVFAGLIVMVAAFVIFIFVSIRLAFIPQVVMVEGVGAVDSLRRSWRLISGSSLRVFGYSIVFSLLVGVLSLLATAAVELVTGTGIDISDGVLVFEPVPFVVGGLIAGLIGIALMPIGTIAMTLLFYDVRFRRESVTEKQIEPRVER